MEEIAPYAFLSFGTGPRMCLGNSFAMTQVVHIVATVLQRLRILLDPDQGEIEPKIEVVLRPKGSVLMRAVPREQPGRPRSRPVPCS
jgi:cytochrome P450